MHEDSISLPQRRTNAFYKRSNADESLSFSTSETSSRGSRRLHYRTVIFPTRFDFALVIIALQTDAVQLMFVFIEFEKYGGVLVFLTTFLLAILVSLPLMVQQMFYGFYNKFGYIKFWNMAPVGFGIGISMAIYSVYECVIWSAVAGLLVLHLCRVPFGSISLWNVCEKVERPEGVECYDTKSELATKSCELTIFPGLEFYRKISFEPQLSNGINGQWFVCCFVVWLSVFVMVSQGFRRLRTVLTRVPVIFILALTLLAVFMFFSHRETSEKHKESIFSPDHKPSSYSVVWLIWHTIRIVQIPLGTLVQLGSYSPSETPLLADAVMLLIFICSFNFAFAYFVHYCHSWIGLKFFDINHACLSPDGMTALFASVPTAVSFLAMGNLWLFVYFAAFALKSIIQIVVTLTATMNAVTETFHLHRHRQHVVAILCVVALLLNLPLVMTDSEVFLKRTCHYVELVVGLCIVSSASLVILCLYTVSRFLDDLHFAYNAEPVMFLKMTSYASPIFIFLAIVIGLTSIVPTWNSDPSFANNPWAPALVGFVIFVILAPIPVLAVYMYIVHLTRHNVSEILGPTENWGPPEEGAKRARLRFNPRSELRHRSKKPCAHNCLVNNIRIKLEVEKRDAQRKEFFLNVFQNPSFVEWGQEEDWHYRSDIIGTAHDVDWTGDFGRRHHPALQEAREVSNLTEDYNESSSRMREEDEEDAGDVDSDFEEDTDEDEDDDENKGDVTTVRFLVQAPFTLKRRNARDNSKNDRIILPDFNSHGPPANIQNLDAHVDAERSRELTPYYVENHPTCHLQRRIPILAGLAKTLIEPPQTIMKIHTKRNRRNLRMQSRPRSRSCQTDKGLNRFPRLLQAGGLLWKKRGSKKRRCIGTDAGCGSASASGSSEGESEASSADQSDEWP